MSARRTRARAPRRSARLVGAALIAFACVPLWVSSAPGLESGAADRRDLGVTVYNDDLALVREVRTIELPAGPSELRFTDVPSAIRPETVSVEAPDGKLEVREQNYEFDLLSHEKVLEKYVGRELTVYVRNEHSGEEHPVAAKLLGTNGGLVFEVGNEIALGLPGRVVVPKLPQDLIARPTLVWSLESAESGARAVEASYLTRGIGWHADYVARLSKDESTLDLTGWVTIRNHSGASFEHAKLKLVAGSVHQIRPPEPAQMEVMARAVPLMASDTARGFSERELFEYHLYELGTPTTLKDNQQKQIELLAAARVPVTKKYRIESTAYSEPRPYAEGTGAAPVRNAAVTLEFLNRKDHALGRALPKGIVRVYKRDADDAFVFAGEDEIDHVPEGETVELEIGDAFDVVWEKAVLESRRIADDRIDADVEFTVRNRKKESVTVTVSERFFGDYDLISSSVAARKPDAFTIEFELAVPAGREAKVRYRVQVRQ